MPIENFLKNYKKKQKKTPNLSLQLENQKFNNLIKTKEPKIKKVEI